MNCPRCHTPVELVADDTVREVVCPSCGSSIEVDPDRTESGRHALRRLGKFEILEQLGIGAFGAVFKARDTELDRLVAIKIPRAGNVATKEDADRFVREARAAARLKHPGIVPVHDASESDGTFFLVSEFVPGVTLADRLLASRFGYRAAAELLVQIADAIDYAHRQGVIHRDLKPSNIMLDLEGAPHVMDFGLAKRDTGEITLTVEGQVLGTPAYMSPEQARGQAHDVDPRSDVYSLGVILYELLTGELPFRGNKRMLILQVLQDEPRPPRRLNDVIPRDLETIALRCLAKDPGRRYGSARDLAEELRRWLRGEPILARPVSQVDKLWRWSRRNPWVAGLIAAVLLLLTSIAIGSTAGMFVIAEQRSQVQRQKKLAEDGRDRAQRSEVSAKESQNAAIAARNEANHARDNELRQLYSADLAIASREVNTGTAGRAIDLLDTWRPENREGVEHRGAEWYLLRRLCGASECTLLGHRGPLRALAWSESSKRIASGGEDRLIRIWDADSGQCVQTLIGHSGGIFDLAFSPDGAQLASASADSTVRIWDVATGTHRHTLDGHLLPVYAVAFHPNGNQLASAGGDTLIKVWDANTGTELFSLQGHEAAIGRLQFDAEGKLLASSGIVRGTIIWDFERRSPVDRLNAPGEFVFTPDLATGAFAYPTGEIGFVSVDAKEVDQGNLGLKQIHALALDKTARIAAIASSDDAIHVVDRQTNSKLTTLRGHTGAVRRLTLSADARRLISAADDGAVRMWNLPDPNGLPFSGHHQHNVTAVSFAANGQLLATGDYLGSIAVWDAATRQRVQILGKHFLRRKSDTKPLRIGTGEPIREGDALQHRSVYTPGTSNPNPIVEVLITQGHAGEVKGLAFTPDRRLLASVGGQDLIIWDVESAQPLLEFEHPTLVSSLAVSTDGTRAATACWDDIIRVFELPSGKLIQQLEGHDNDVVCLAFHPAARELASGSRDRTVIVWDVATGKLKHRLRGHENTVSAIAYTPNGARIISAGMDRSLQVWTRETGAWEAALIGHMGKITSLAMSTDGNWLVSACDDPNDPAARVWLWNAGGFRECLSLPSSSRQGLTAIAVHPTTSAIILGRGQLEVFESAPFQVRPSIAAPVISPERLRNVALPNDRLKVLGHAYVQELAVWPGGEMNRRKPAQPGGTFLVVAASLPFNRLRMSADDYQRLVQRWQRDQDFPQPLKSSSLLVYPHRFVLADEAGKLTPAAFVGRIASSQPEGFEFMDQGQSLLENLTDTPAKDDRQLVYLGWEVSDEKALGGQRLKYDSDPPVSIPPLKLETLRPGKPFYPATRDFKPGEGEDRLRSNLTRSPGL